MDLTTRCPKCSTVFQASLADLQLRKGYIRCVQCAYIFDGYAEVVSDSGKEPFLQDLDLDQGIDSEPDFNSDFDSGYNIKPDSDSDDEPNFRIDDSDEASADENDGFSINLASPGKSAQAESFILEADPKRRTGSGSVYQTGHRSGFVQSVANLFSWSVLVILVLLLILQGAYIYRAQIAQNFNFTRPLLEKYCSYLSCEVPYLRDIDSLVITKSALKLIQPKATDITDSDQAADQSKPADKPSGTNQNQPEIRNYELQFNLRNLAKLDQEWPTVVLNLKDSSGQVQIKRNLTPKDYLTQLSPAIPAQSETFITIPVELKGNTQVNGFHLDLFFP